jgi:hypothetical protein
LDGVIDHEFGRCERIHTLRIASQPDDGFAHGGQIDDAGHTREILHDDARRSKRDLVVRQGLRVPLDERFDIAPGDVDAVFETQQVFQEYFQGKR